ncbi:hypothetical protein [Paraflavitalea speifideaquila]|uniref:hypothetical protein n=1 Tax=Paraflavitalea speifideaquila TaxID=3076558 RepID=UPI0028E4326A|nr:hypothetical protein [Paraflavitalea speifideiaquila]
MNRLPDTCRVQKILSLLPYTHPPFTDFTLLVMTPVAPSKLLSFGCTAATIVCIKQVIPG